MSKKTTRCDKCAKITASTKRYWAYKSAMDNDDHRTRLLNRFSSIVGRCRNPKNNKYADYGGRGISVCDEWMADRATFLAYVQTLEGWYKPELELDRICNDGNYEPGNIRFVTRKENISNRRSVRSLQKRIDALEEENERLKKEIASLRHS